ncbi:MAG: hypothetical protein ACI4TD_04075 [Phocaeicola sp.]
MREIKFKITGTTPLMLNNPQTVNPLNKYAKQLKDLTSKRTKTEEDLFEISHIKFLASLYTDSEGTYIIPNQHFERSVIEAAKERKLGKRFERSFHVFDRCVLDFKDKDKTPEELYQIGDYVDIRPVGVKNVKITTTRVIIFDWSTVVNCCFEDGQIDQKDVIDIFKIAGLRYGIGTYRSQFGKFEVQKIK